MSCWLHGWINSSVTRWMNGWWPPSLRSVSRGSAARLFWASGSRTRTASESAVSMTTCCTSPCSMATAARTQPITATPLWRSSSGDIIVTSPVVHNVTGVISAASWRHADAVVGCFVQRSFGGGRRSGDGFKEGLFKCWQGSTHTSQLLQQRWHTHKYTSSVITVQYISWAHLYLLRK